jgi:hypothetical protein
MATWIAALSVACLLLSAAAGASVGSTAVAAAADAAAGSSIKRRLQAALNHAEGNAAVDQVGIGTCCCCAASTYAAWFALPCRC